MGRIKSTFEDLERRQEKGLVIYLTAGDPDMETSLELFTCAAMSGADILEVGIPFSDPMADGPVIQRAFKRALEKGATVKKALSMVRKLRRIVETPVVLFGYLNPLLAYGVDRFFQDAEKAGADGILIVDLPWEEWAPYRQKALRRGLDWVGLVAPTSGEERIEKITRDTTGFVYVISVTGITGARSTLPRMYKKMVKSVRENVDTPVAVGFGISTPEMAENVSRSCDGVVIGSACVRIIEKWGNNREALLRKLSRFIENTKTRLMNGDIQER